MHSEPTKQLCQPVGLWEDWAEYLMCHALSLKRLGTSCKGLALYLVCQAFWVWTTVLTCILHRMLTSGRRKPHVRGARELKSGAPRAARIAFIVDLPVVKLECSGWHIFVSGWVSQFRTKPKTFPRTERSDIGLKLQQSVIICPCTAV